MAPWALALQGMAVVAPDYSGLGVGLPSRPDDPSPRHQWFGVSNSADIAHAITAARAAFPSLLSPTGPFTVMGHSEGGGAAWAFAERQVATPLAGYRGAVAIAPTTFLDDLEAAYGTVETDPQVELLGVVPLVIDAVTSYFPSYNWSSFTDKARDRYEHVLKPLRGCLPTENLAFGVDFQPTDFAGPGWLEADEVLEWSNLTAVGRKTFAGPLLVIGGERDGTVLIDTLKSAVDDTCDLVAADGDAESLEFAVYTGVSHFPAIQASQGRWMQWIKDRLAGKALKTKGGCTLETVEGLRTEFTAQSILPNFLVTSAGGEIYQYAL
ncbi:alpha/beta-hydrolase [Xylariomycetidae sp. FL2044]|nr:alpha/beta-hydrolase [Xylariomycetidae sp. FL2044]